MSEEDTKSFRTNVDSEKLDVLHAYDVSVDRVNRPDGTRKASQLLLKISDVLSRWGVETHG